jgi:lysophospholipid hydrolase
VATLQRLQLGSARLLYFTIMNTTVGHALATAQSEPISRFSVSPTITFLGYIITLIYRIAFWLLALVTYQIPRWTIAVLSWGGVISLEFNAIKLFLLFLGLSISLNWAIKARYLNRYTKLREPPLRTDEKIDLHPDVAAENASGGISNYLDEFCQFLEFGRVVCIDIAAFQCRPSRCLGTWKSQYDLFERHCRGASTDAVKQVFHELARHLQTKRMIAGDTLSLDSSDFYVVVDGSMQVYAQIRKGEAIFCVYRRRRSLCDCRWQCHIPERPARRR